MLAHALRLAPDTEIKSALMKYAGARWDVRLLPCRVQEEEEEEEEEELSLLLSQLTTYS